MDRRSFVKACVTTAGVGALAASGLGLAAGLEIPRKAAASAIRYFGCHRVGGPAPRGIPYIPITVNANGEFEGKTTLPNYKPGDPDINNLDWYKYCQHQGAPGLIPAHTKDNTLTYLGKEDYESTITPWFKPYLPPPAEKGGPRPLGQPVKPSHFVAENFGAAFEWRSAGVPFGTNLLTGIIIRAPLAEVKRVTTTVAPAKPISADEFKWVLNNVFHAEKIDSSKPVDVDASGNLTNVKALYIGVSSFCTHFCCTPGYREAEKLARPRNAWDNIFCTCHNSNYNYRQPVAFTFAPDVAASLTYDPLFESQGAS